MFIIWTDLIGLVICYCAFQKNKLQLKISIFESEGGVVKYFKINSRENAKFKQTLPDLNKYLFYWDDL